MSTSCIQRKRAMILEKIVRIKNLRHQKEQIIKEEHEAWKPSKHDLDEMAGIYAKFQQVCDPTNEDNKKIIIYILFFMYSPLSCVGRGKRGSVRGKIAKVMGLSNSMISQHFCDAKILFVRHKGFREETERVYQLLLE